MTNTQFTFRRSWLEAINLIKAKSVRNRLLAAIVEYGLNRTYTPVGNTAADAIMLLIIDQIDSAEEAAILGGDSASLSQDSTNRGETYRRDAGIPDNVCTPKIKHRALSIANRALPGGDSVPLSQDSTNRGETYRRDAGIPGKACPGTPKIKHRALSIENRPLPGGDSVSLSQESTARNETYRRDAGIPDEGCPSKNQTSCIEH